MDKGNLPLFIIMFFVPLFFLSGCGGVLYPHTYGDEKLKDETYLSRLTPNKTTMNDVQELFGKPRGVAKTSNGDVVWTYAYSKVWLRDFTSKSISITFHKGLLKDYTYAESSDESFFR